MHEISDPQRRARLGVRQALAQPVDTVEEVVAAVTCLHSTEPPSVYLSVAARSTATREDVARALYEDRTVVKQLAMRRTLFTFPRTLLPAVWGSASRRVARQLRTRLAKEVQANGVAERGEAWVEEMCEAVLQALAEEGPATTAELRERIPALGTRLEMAPGKSYGGHIPIGPRLLGALGVTGRVLRGVNMGDWRVSRPRWTLAEDWLGETPEAAEPEDGYREVVRRWLHRFGPGTETDLVWWLGATKGAVRRALADLGAVEVRLAEGTGYLLPDDLDDVPEPEPWAALLPVLDPTTMGWKQRAFYLGTDGGTPLFDPNGNAGTTAWWGGQVVGCWVQDPDGVVRVVPAGAPGSELGRSPGRSLGRTLGSEATAALQGEADRLTAWLAGDRVSTVYPSPLMRSGQPRRA